MTPRTAVKALLTLLTVAAVTAISVATAAAAPPDRVAEMVTPFDKNGGASSSTVGPPQVTPSTDGNRLFFMLQPAALPDAESNFGVANWFLADRQADGWRSQSLLPALPPGSDPPPTGSSTPQPQAYSPDLSRILFRSTWNLDTERDADRPFQDNDTYVRGPDGEWQMLSCLVSWACDAEVSVSGMQSTPDFGHVVFSTEEPLVPGAPNAEQVYDHTGGQLRWVSRGTPLAGGAPLGSASRALTGGRTPISEDGSRIFFRSIIDPSTDRLYVRIDNDKTFEVTRTYNDATTAPNPGFHAISPDGNTALFSTAAALTVDDQNTVADLYAWRYDPVTQTDSLQRVGALPQVGPSGDPSPNNPGPGLGASPANAVFVNVPALSTDPEEPLRVYFTARSGGTTTADPSVSRLFVATDPGLPSGTVRFVSRLTQASNLVGTNLTQCLGSGVSANVCAGTTPDGRYMAFDSRLALTADDQDTVGANTCTTATVPTSGTGSTSVPAQCKYDTYLYDAEALTLTRVSIGNDGPAGAMGNGGIDARLGTAVGEIRNLLDDGTVFFNTKEALVPGDANVFQDAYEFKDGELRILTGGRADAEKDSFFANTTLDGRDVFVYTQSPLDPRDTDGGFDVYDARAGGGFPEPPQPCDPLADACRNGDGALALDPKPGTGDPGEGDEPAGVRRALWVSGLGAKARRRAARSGRLAVPVRLNVPGTVSAIAKGRLGKRTRTVGRGSVDLATAGKGTLRIGLSRAARRSLRRGHTLVLRIQAKSPGARTRTVTVRLPGVPS